MILVDGGVPDGVQVVGGVVVFDREFITTSVTSGEVRVDSVAGVEWLMDVSNIVNKESYGIRSTEGLFVSSVGHNGLVDIGVLVISIVAEPVNKFWDNKSDIVSIEFVVRVVTNT